MFLLSEIKIQYIESDEEGGNCYVTLVRVRSGGLTPWPKAVAEAAEEARSNLLRSIALDLTHWSASESQ